MYYLKEEDLATVIIGPFETLEQMGTHAKLVIERGGSGTLTPLSEAGYEFEKKHRPGFCEYTPERDIELWARCMAELATAEQAAEANAS